MAVLASLYFENLGRTSSFSCRDLIRIENKLDEICTYNEKKLLSEFCVDSEEIDIESHLPDDYLDDEDIDLDELDELESEVEGRIGPWFDLLDGIETLQSLIQSIERGDFRDLLDQSDLESVLPTLKEFKQEMLLRTGETNKFRIVYN